MSDKEECFNIGMICLISGSLIIPSVDCLNCVCKNKQYEETGLIAKET